MIPSALTVHQKSRMLEISFDQGPTFMLPFELLRVYSPSAEVRGHGAGQEVLQLGKREVGVTALEPVGNYAIQPHFTDGHNTGLYTWELLHKLSSEQEALWADYMQRLHAAGFEGDSGRAPGAVLPGAATAHKGCGHNH